MKLKSSFKIITFGCRVNQAESRMMGEKLVKLGISQTSNSGKARIIIINTCCVTSKAEREVRKEIRRIKRENPSCFLIVVGCWPEKIKNLKLKTPDLKIDLLIGNKKKLKIAEVLKKYFKKIKKRGLKQETYQDKYLQFAKALIKIQDGCNKFCSYCIVPYVRGRLASRRPEEIIREIKQKVKKGIKEVVLTGIDIADYKLTTKEANDLVKLIKLILTKTKIKKISFGSLGLGVFDKEFFDLYQSSLSNRLTTHFHIPLQSGCNQTLKRMARKYRVEEFNSKIVELKKNLKHFTFSTDIIVGFPGETEKEFKQSLKTIKSIKKMLNKNFTHIHIFRFSPKKGTLASKMEGKWGQIDEKIKKKRAAQIRKIISLT